MWPVILTVAGVGLGLVGVFSLAGWVGGKSRWFDAGVYDRPGASKNDRQFLDLYFIVLVLAPLLAGAIMIISGLRKFR